MNALTHISAASPGITQQPGPLRQPVSGGSESRVHVYGPCDWQERSRPTHGPRSALEVTVGGLPARRECSWSAAGALIRVRDLDLIPPDGVSHGLDTLPCAPGGSPPLPSP